jgi:hypothetical protein
MRADTPLPMRARRQGRRSLGVRVPQTPPALSLTLPVSRTRTPARASRSAASTPTPLETSLLLSRSRSLTLTHAHAHYQQGRGRPQPLRLPPRLRRPRRRPQALRPRDPWSRPRPGHVPGPVTSPAWSRPRPGHVPGRCVHALGTDTRVSAGSVIFAGPAASRWAPLYALFMLSARVCRERHFCGSGGEPVWTQRNQCSSIQPRVADKGQQPETRPTIVV